MSDVTAGFESDTAESSLLPTPAKRGSHSIRGGLKPAQEVADLIATIAVQLGCGPRHEFQTRLVLEEALANAVKHGNRHDANKAVHVSYEITVDGIKVTVRDEGEGFDRQTIPNPTDCDGLSRPNGRGLYLMSQYTDSLKYNDIGNCVTFTKSWSDPKDPSSVNSD